MKRLFLLRHAKTEPGDWSKPDFERNLIEKGVTGIRKVADYFTEKYSLPELILCSTANRTRQTLELFKMKFEWTPDIMFLDELYHASASDIFQIISQYSADQIMIIGHNFGISDLANELSDTPIESMSTSSIVIIDFENTIEWRKGKIKEIIKPKQL